jgi:hypothetical protein
MSITASHGFSVYANGEYRNRYSPVFKDFVGKGNWDEDKIIFAEKKDIAETDESKIIEIYFPLLCNIKESSHEIPGTASPGFTLNALCQHLLICIADTLEPGSRNFIGAIAYGAINNRNQFARFRTTGIECVFIFLFCQAVRPRLDTQPTFFLQEIQKYNLTKQFLCGSPEHLTILRVPGNYLIVLYGIKDNVGAFAQKTSALIPNTTTLIEQSLSR